MANIRQWLQDPASNSGVAKDMGTMTDRALHDALLETGLLVHIRRVYMLKVTGVAATDPFRCATAQQLCYRGCVPWELLWTDVGHVAGHSCITTGPSYAAHHLLWATGCGRR